MPIYAAFPSAIHFTLQMEAARSPKMLVLYCNTTQCHNPEDLILNQFSKWGMAISHITNLRYS